MGLRHGIPLCAVASGSDTRAGNVSVLEQRCSYLLAPGAALILRTVRLSVPFVPPSKQYISLEKMVELFPNWGYQLYFREKSTNSEIERNVRHGCVPGCARVTEPVRHVSYPSSSNCSTGIARTRVRVSRRIGLVLETSRRFSKWTICITIQGS